jgi:hypothetical protein
VVYTDIAQASKGPEMISVGRKCQVDLLILAMSCQAMDAGDVEELEAVT